MFEFHGWAVITVDDPDDDDLAVVEERTNQAEAALRTILATASDNFCVFEIQHTCNALRYLNVHGQRNHRYEPAITLFQWIADHLPACYGLLYVRDDEDLKRTRNNYTNCFRVWRLARGHLTEEADPFLSPCVPVIELPE
jgi:hypothetical protein